MRLIRVLGIVFGTLVLLIAAPAACNSYRLSVLRSRVEGLPHPEGTEPLTTYSELGILSGNGNHCDYFVGHLRAHTSARESIDRFYKGTSFVNPVSGESESVRLVWFPDDGELDEFLPYDFDRVHDWDLAGRAASEVYAVVVMRSYLPNADPRCH